MQRDLVLRWIESMAKLIRALLRRGDAPSLEAAQDQLENAAREYLGPMADLARRLEPASVAEILADPYRIYGYAHLVALESAVARALGRRDEADRLAARGVALGELAIERHGNAPPEWTTWVAAAQAGPEWETAEEPPPSE
ncbi:MAG: hypothetical protein ABI647_11780 [Gemmatimonadota bacterium]